jgi:mono/diheme cytochrome c family protein
MAGTFAIAAAVVVWMRGSAEAPAASTPPPAILEQARPSLRLALPGDPAFGARMYPIHCASCHGLSGDGLGTSASVVWPAPRDHTDAGYMNLRSNQDLFTAIHGGGTKVNRSRLMPPFNEKFDEVETWSLVAFIRTLHPNLSELIGHRPAKYGEVVLSKARAEALAKAIRADVKAPDYRIVYYTFADGYVAFPRTELGHTLNVIFKKDFSIRMAQTFRRLVLPRENGLDVTAVDRFMEQFTGWTPRDVLSRPVQPIPEFEALSESIVRRIKKSLVQMELAVAQEQDDAAESKTLYESFRSAPEKLPRGQRLYLENCMSCHGVLGRPLEVREDFKPRSLSDPEFMAQLQDDYLRKVITQGGAELNLSPVMPAIKLSSDELSDLVAYVRSLSAIKPGGKCPCQILGRVCQMAHGPDGSCKCVDDLHGGGCCPQIRK